jgi:hypothetical protein
VNIVAPVTTPNSRMLRLIGLAQEATPAKRHELLLEITTIFVETARGLSDKERDIFCLIIAQLAQTSPPSERRALGARLAAVPGVAPSLLQDLGPSESELIALLRQGRAREFASALARALECRLEDVEALFADPLTGALAQACRDVGFARATYSTIVLLSDPLHLRSGADTERLLTLFAAAPISVETPHAA